MPEQDTLPPSRTVPKKKRRISLVWILPIVAALAGLWVAVTRIMSEGPTITLILHSAEGLEAGKTKVRYHGVDVGELTEISLTDDHQKVVGKVAMQPFASDFLVEDTRFWVVRPRVSGANITGLSTLISGAYIGMDVGHSTKSQRKFDTLATPPLVGTDMPGHHFTLKTPELGSLDSGTPIFFRRFKVGEVISYTLDEDGKSLSVKIFINDPYDQYVNNDTRFWHAGGVDVSLSASGLKVETQSVLSILIGGIAFETPPTATKSTPAAADTQFTLFGNRTEAFQLPRGEPQTYVLEFGQSVRGLNRGAPVEFRGIPIGEVTEIEPHLDTTTYDFIVRVTINVYPHAMLGIPLFDHAEGPEAHRKRLDALTTKGLRAQLRSGSLLTGALYVAMDLFPDAAPATLDWSRDPVALATVPGQVEELEAQVTGIVRKLDAIPLDKIGADLSKTVVDLDKTLISAKATLDAAEKTLGTATSALDPNSALLSDVSSTLLEVSRAAQSLRDLMDYLERHPESLLKGKTGDTK